MEYKLGLIGYPLGHSMSPILYETALKQFNLKGSYELLPTEAEDLITRIKQLRRDKYFGFNVTARPARGKGHARSMPSLTISKYVGWGFHPNKS